MSVSQLNKPLENVKCECGRIVFDGEAIKSRCVKPGLTVSYALCKCKQWVKVPIKLSN